MSSAHADDGFLSLSTMRAGKGERRAAIAVLAASAVAFAAIAPFAKTPLPPWPGFIALYESALVINDLITAVFMYSQFQVLRMRSLLYLASGYLFTALLAMAHALTFPGLFAATGLLGAGPQSTAWLYMFWHAGFPLLVIAYALQRGTVGEGATWQSRSRLLVLCSVAATAAAAGALTMLATAGQDVLPPIMAGHHYTAGMIFVVASVWVLSAVALLLVWLRRPHSVLDMWLLVVLSAWIFDIALSAVLNAGRFDLGFYAGRVYGLLATGCVLAFLLFESGRLHSRLIERHRSDRARAAELEQLNAADALTGIANRRAFDQALDQEWRRSLRTGMELSLLLIDVDCFKLYNDTYGHVAGDHCLQRVAQVLAGSARRAGEVAARYGGEEFAVVLPNTVLRSAITVADHIRRAVMTKELMKRSTGEHLGRITVSVGVATLRPGDTVVSLIERADTCLYAAKRAGRNRVISETDPELRHAHQKVA
jgi:diguanylate cyclase (GGDEF)-like protein